MPSVLEAFTRHKFTLKEAMRVLEACITPNREQGKFPWQNTDVKAVPVLIGEAGVGKTECVRQTARKLGLEYRDSQIGARAFEDALGIPSREEDPKNPGHHRMLAPPGFPSDSPKRGKFIRKQSGEEFEYDGQEGHMTWLDHKKHGRVQVLEYTGCGLYFHDEIMTADVDKQNQIRDMIDNRRVGMLMMSDGWFQAGATNPPTKGFVTVKRMDIAIEDRLLYIPVQPDWSEALGYWEANNVVPKVLIHYLLWKNGEGFWGGAKDESKIGSRRWVLVGNLIERLQAAGASEDDLAVAIALNLTPSHAENFKRFLKFGEDQTKYPIRAMDLISPERLKANQDVMRYWKKEGKHALLSTSVLALRAWGYAAREKADFNMSNAQVKTLAKILNPDMLSLDQIQDLLTVFGSSAIGPDLVVHMDLKEEVMAKLSKATDIADGKAKVDN